MKLSIVIPVYNEQATINDTLDHIRALSDAEVIVSDAIGNTLKYITQQGIIKTTSSKGRGIQMNTGAENATGDAFLFLHADTRLSENFEKEIESALKTHSVGAFRLKFDSGKIIYRLSEKFVAIRNRLTGHPYGDQAVFCTREAFEAVGGYRDIPLMEDVRFMQDCKKMKYTVFLSSVPVYTSTRRWEKTGFIAGTLRNWALITLYYAGVSPVVLKKFYK